MRQGRAVEDGLEDQPFRSEAVERRQRRDGGGADKESEGGRRHAVDEAAEALDVAPAGRHEDGAGAEEEQALEQCVVEYVKQCGEERQSGKRTEAVCLEGEGEADAASSDRSG